MRSCHNVLWEKSLSNEIDETTSPEFTQEQAREMYDLVKELAQENYGMISDDARLLLKQLESDE